MSHQKILTGTVKSILLGAGLVFVTQPAFAGIDIDIKAIFGSEQKTVEQPATKKGPPDHAPAHGYRAKHRYRYYPVTQVYYNIRRGSYIYYHNGRWEVSVSLPERIKININEYVTLEMDTDRPYTYHTDVIKKYPPGQVKKRKRKKQWNK